MPRERMEGDHRASCGGQVSSNTDASPGGKPSCGIESGCRNGGAATDFLMEEAAEAGGGGSENERARGTPPPPEGPVAGTVKGTEMIMQRARGTQDGGDGAWLYLRRGGVSGGVRKSVRRWVSGALLCALGAASLASPAGAFARSPSRSCVSGWEGLILDKRRATLETLLLLRGAHPGGRALQALRGGEGGGATGLVGEGPAVEDNSLVANGGVAGVLEPLPSSLLNLHMPKKRMTRAHSQVSL